MILDKRGFTLIELLVVMSIIGILSAALVVSMPKVSERARDMKCKSNLRSLAQATLTYAIGREHFPWAQPHENRNFDRGGVRYYDVKAWVNWTGNGVWPNRSSQRSMMTLPKLDGDLAYTAITNGTIWSLTGKDASIYLCPAFKKQAVVQGMDKIWRSYAMNRYFRWHGGSGSGFHWHSDFTRDWGGVQRSAETVLMFAELPADDIDISEKGGDGQLNPDDDEHIGFNHRVGKRNISHVVYADGHVGVLLQPAGGSKKDLVELTKQLCLGKPIERALLREMR